MRFSSITWKFLQMYDWCKPLDLGAAPYIKSFQTYIWGQQITFLFDALYFWKGDAVHQAAFTEAQVSFYFTHGIFEIHCDIVAEVFYSVTLDANRMMCIPRQRVYIAK